MVWDEHASNMIPLVKRLDYHEDYERMLTVLSAKHSGKASAIVRKWNDKCFGRDSEAYMSRRLGLR